MWREDYNMICVNEKLETTGREIFSNKVHIDIKKNKTKIAPLRKTGKCKVSIFRVKRREERKNAMKEKRTNEIEESRR